MADNSAIEWTDATWNPLRARNVKTGALGWFCTHASEGCRNCYAEGLNNRLGTKVDYKPVALKDDIDLFLDQVMLRQPLRWARARQIFVCSMTDIFADFWPIELIDQMWAVMAITPHHTYQVLTKRGDLMAAYTNDPGLGLRIGALLMDFARGTLGPELAVIDIAHALTMGKPLPNVWCGVSVEDHPNAMVRVRQVLKTRAAVRFLSVEPLLSQVDLFLAGMKINGLLDLPTGQRRFLDWVIVGGESGPRARPCDLHQVGQLITDCKMAGTPCFVKQLGARPTLGGKPVPLKDRKGGDMAEWPEHLRVRQMPERSAA